MEILVAANVALWFLNAVMLYAIAHKMAAPKPPPPRRVEDSVDEADWWKNGPKE